TITFRPRACASLDSAALAAACASGSPPSSVMPSRPFFCDDSASRDTTSSTVIAVPPSNGSISGLQQPGQRSGQPWNHSAKRFPGPSASVQATQCATRAYNSLTIPPPYSLPSAFSDLECDDSSQLLHVCSRARSKHPK